MSYYDAARIIPARAGFTMWRPSSGLWWPDHPRSRGVYACLVRKLHRGWRIIPARAGFTPRPWVTGRANPDHPRSRGVYVFLEVPGKGHLGSSPLARGLHSIRGAK